MEHDGRCRPGNARGGGAAAALSRFVGTAELVPGTVSAVSVSLFPVANLFALGHRLRLDIAGRNVPYFDVNPNSGAAEGSMAGVRIAHTRVFADRARPSHRVLPVIPRRGDSR
jgi:uncharacterized protein